METEEIGYVTSVQGKIAFVDGLPTVQIGELVVTENGAMGYVGGLFVDRTEVYLLTGNDVEPGHAFRRKGEFLSLPGGDFLFGRVIDPVGRPVDGKGWPLTYAKAERVRIDQTAVGISGRRFITQQFDTGITVIDTVFPLGRGQRELVLGDSRSGKSSFLIDLVANQKNTGVICVYVLIGKPIAEARDVWLRLGELGLMGSTVIVASTSLDPAPLVFLAPMAGMTMAQFWQKKGRDVLIILDDMGTHARSYREISLVAGRPPGRESYPGDIFFQQARIMERAGCFNQADGGGSITALPVMELALSDFSGYIPTNLMGMTDGHLLFKSELAKQGQRPAIDLFLSVTRVGSQTQNRIQNLMAMKVKQTLARGRELEVVSRFGSELPFETKLILNQKEQIEELLIQKPFVFVSKEIQTILLALPFTKFMETKDRIFLRNNFDNILAIFETASEKADVFKKTTLPELFTFVEGLCTKLTGF